MPVSTLSMFGETARTYLTMRIGEITLDPPYTAILIAALAAALLSAFKLWLIGKQEDRQARLESTLPIQSEPKAIHVEGTYALPVGHAQLREDSLTHDKEPLDLIPRYRVYTEPD